MHKLTFFPLGNADCCLINLDDGSKILFDYANQRDPNDKEDLRIDLPEELHKILDEDDADEFDVVAFTHLDKDHFAGATEFFYLEHAEKYQDNDRIKIKEMWVPAAVITETGLEDDEAKIIQKEARYRLKQGEGIRVFSRPDRLEKWLKSQNLTLKDREHLITDAGKTIPGFTKEKQGVEFFVHSPFAKRLDDGTLENRNEDALVVQATFTVGGTETKLILSADATSDVLSDIVDITKKRKNEVRLEWDIFKIPHHCSYKSLDKDNKGEDKTTPVKEVKWLFEDQGQDRGIVVSTSKPIPTKGSDEDKDDNPPHRQAANYYEDVRKKHNGEFIVTMEHPKKSSPQPLNIEIDEKKATVSKKTVIGASIITGQSSPRAGFQNGR